MTRGALLRREAAEYMNGIVLTQGERQELLDWIKEGNSAYDNPWHMADDNGRLMDFISAIRIAQDYRDASDSASDACDL